MPEAKIVGRGVDTLVLNVCYADKQFQSIKLELDADLQEKLSTLQDEARINEAAVVTEWAFKGFNLFMQPKGSRGRLSSIIAQVCLSSEYLWSCETASDAIVEISLLLYDLFGEYLWVQVSEVDLCADSIGWDVASTNWQEGFVSRAVSQNGRPVDVVVDGPDVARLRWKQVATLDFGKHTSPISCCIHHKTAEIRQKSPTKVWFHDLWQRNGWDGSSEVWRVEFRLTREFLYSVHIEDVHDLPEHLPSLQSAHGVIEVESLRLEHLRGWMAHLKKTPIYLGKPLSDESIYSYGQSLLAFCHWLEREELIEKAITPRFKLPRVEKKFVPIHLKMLRSF